MNKFLSFCKTLYFINRQTWILLRQWLFARMPKEPKQIPIIINNYNRVSFLKVLVERLERDGYKNIHIIDNNSTYPPLLEYYENCPHRVIRLKDNVGFLSLWQTGLYKEFKNQYFVYTDSDVVPDDSSPSDYLAHFLELLKKYPRASKVGFSLRIDNIPDTFANKGKVLEWESRFWTTPLNEEKTLYRAAIDTTFALYRPNVSGGAYFHDFMIRTAGEYSAKHLPWYNDDSALSDEDKYYIAHAKTSTHWTAIQNKE